jgi:hypothetical protein
MATLIRSWELENGLTVQIIDDTVNYYGDYYNVKLTIRCMVLVKEEYLASFTAQPDFQKIREMLPTTVEYRREIVKAGVAGGKLLGTKTHLMESFEKNALCYFERRDFGERFVQKKFTELQEELRKKERMLDS